MPAESERRASLLDEVLAQTAAAGAAARTRLDAFLGAREVAQQLLLWLGLGPGSAVPARAAIVARLGLDVAALDRLIGAQVDAILHAPELQRLEASWRGLAYLVGVAAEADGVVVRVLDASWRALARDLDRAIEFDQSVLFGKVYSEEFGTPGGRPFGLLLGDYFLAHRPRPDQPVDDVRALRGIAQVAAAAFAPFVAGAHPALFGLDSLRGLGPRIDIARVFAQVEYTGWNALRGLDDARFLALVLPRVLMRPPWRPDAARADGFRYEEDVADPSGEGYLWGNACYAFGGVAIRAFDRSGWFGEIRGVEEGQAGGGLVTDLPAPDDGGQFRAGSRPVTEVVVTDSLERALADQGLIALAALHGLPWAAFYSAPSLQRPPRFDDADAAANARLSAMLQYMLCTARIAHHLKMMCRDRTGSFASAADIEQQLGDWLFRLSVSSEDVDPAAQARHPLADTAVAVHEVPGKPGTFASIIHLRPHFQLDRMTSTIRLATEILTAR
jgi:type VI secretion system ImpC/EvpB family protein